MINDSKKEMFDLIITKEISRFSRNTLDSIKYTRELLKSGVAVFFVNDNINTILPDAELRLTIMASLAQDEVRRLSERVRFGMNRAIERKEILGNNLLYGYRKDKISKKLIIVPKEAEIVVYIYKAYTIDKLSISQIVKGLNSKNIKTSMGNKFSISTVSRMIENPKYKGYYCGRKTRVVNYMSKKVKYLEKNEWITCKDYEKIPPIISEKLWNLANTRLIERKNSYKKTTNNKVLYLYSNKIYCLKDKKVFYRRYFKKDKKDATWVCSNYLKNGKVACSSPNLRESELNLIFDNIVKKLNISNDDVINYLIGIYNKSYKYEDHINELEKIKDKKNKLLDLYLEKVITKAEFVSKVDNLTSKTENLEGTSFQEELNNIANKLNNKITSNKIRKLITSFLLRRIEVSILNKIIILDIFLSIENNNFIDKVVSNRENNKVVTYILKYHYSS